jgi:tRNA-splicing ligase RtcB
MDISHLARISDCVWRMEPREGMHVPAIIFADEALIRAMDEKVGEQIANVARLPGIVGAACAMPDAHWGYGFPIGGVAAFDPNAGVVSAGGVGFDISCGVRALVTGLTRGEIEPVKESIAHSLYRTIPAGLGSRGEIELDDTGMDAMLRDGAGWAIAQGYGDGADLARIEEQGRMSGARPDQVSALARERQRAEMGTLGSGNHYLEMQEIAEIYDPPAAAAFGLRQGEIIVSIHCGSRGLGHQIGTEFLREMVIAAPTFGIALPDLELACAPIASDLGRRYLGAMRAATNCALANRQILTHLTRKVFHHFFPGTQLDLLYDVSHNTCKEEWHRIDGKRRRCSFIARARPAPSAPCTLTFLRRCGRRVSRSSSAAAWERSPPSWSAATNSRTKPSHRPAMARGAA